MQPIYWYHEANFECGSNFECPVPGWRSCRIEVLWRAMAKRAIKLHPELERGRALSGPRGGGTSHAAVYGSQPSQPSFKYTLAPPCLSVTVCLDSQTGLCLPQCSGGTCKHLHFLKVAAPKSWSPFAIRRQSHPSIRKLALA